MPMSNEVITHKHELQLLQSRISTSNSRTQHNGSCAVWDAVTEGNVEITQWVRGLFSELDRIAKVTIVASFNFIPDRV